MTILIRATWIKTFRKSIAEYLSEGLLLEKNKESPSLPKVKDSPDLHHAATFLKTLR